MTKILALAALLGVILAGCVPFDRGYFKLSRQDGGGNTDWAATSREVGKLLNK